MKKYIFFLKMLLLMSLLLAPLKVLGKSYPNLYIIFASASIVYIIAIFFYCLVKRKLFVENLNQVVVYVIAICFWMIIGINNGYYVASEASSLLLMMLFLIAVNISYNEKLISSMYIRKISYLLMYCWSGIYVIIGAGLLFQIIPNSAVLQLMSIWLGADPSKAIHSGFGGMIPRMGAGENILPLIIYAFYLVDKKGGSIFTWLMMFLFVLVDYGRIDMGFFLFLTIMYLYLKANNAKFNIKNTKVLVISSVVIVMFLNNLFTLNNIDINDFFMGWTERYGRESTERYLQVKYLTEYIDNSLWFGYGLGSYTPEYTRSSELWVYEMQFHAFLMQLGILGLLAIVLNYIMYFCRLVFCSIDKRYILVVLACLAYWLVDSAFQGGVYYGVGRMVCMVIYMLTRKENSIV